MKNIIRKVCAGAMAVSIVLMCPTGATYYADYSSQIDELEYEQSLIKQELNDLEYRLSEFEEGARESEEYMRIYDEKMSRKEDEINNIRMQITALNAAIRQTSERISDKEDEVADELDRFRERLRVMYMDGNESLTSVVVGAQDFYDLLIRSELVERISRHDKEMIDDLKFHISELDTHKKELEGTKALAEEKQQEARENLEELREIYRSHEETKEYYEAQAQLNREKSAEMRERQEDVEYELSEMIRKQQEENARREEEERQRREREREEQAQREEEYSSYYEDEDDYYYEDEDEDYYESGSDYEEDEEDYDTYYYSSGSSDLMWPCPNVWNITDGYGWRTIDEEGGSSDFHGGIDINKPGCYGETIVASASGTVLTAGDTGNGFGIHVVIDHGGSLSTLYAHMSSCTVSAGDYVSQGQTIGYIGSTGYAYGNHCHFEVRVNGERTDPLAYLDY
ncbi:MAG: peptidoglycan DD-metalloendopeptidase family protein [Oscillospiraceae bacterium]|nr:peptidoglycan DD-metalloendopeptidase family protein [Oscillospiraceae bacterium]